MQGSVLGPIKAAVHMDKIGQSSTENEQLYSYKNIVEVPAIKMIDDVASIKKCGANALIENAHINCQVEMKKLPLNKNKCKKLHIGKSNQICPDLNIQDKIIDKAQKEKYLGDQITSYC